MNINLTEDNYKLIQQNGFNVDNFLNELVEEYFFPTVQDLTEEEEKIFKEAEAFYSKHPELCSNKLTDKELDEIVAKAKSGEELAKLLGYPDDF